MPTKLAAQKEDAAAKAAPARKGRRGGAATVEAIPSIASEARPVAPPLGADDPPFFLVFHPDRWMISEGLVVPCLIRLPAQAGAMAVREAKDGTPLMDRARAECIRRGETIIPHDIDGPGTSYLARVVATGGWITRWESVFSGQDTRRCDAKAYAQWMVSLIARGVITPCPAYQLEGMLGDLQARREQAVKGGPDKYAAKIARIDADIVVVTAELAKVDQLEAAAETAIPEGL